MALYCKKCNGMIPDIGGGSIVDGCKHHIKPVVNIKATLKAGADE